ASSAGRVRQTSPRKRGRISSTARTEAGSTTGPRGIPRSVVDTAPQSSGPLTRSPPIERREARGPVPLGPQAPAQDAHARGARRASRNDRTGEHAGDPLRHLRVRVARRAQRRASQGSGERLLPALRTSDSTGRRDTAGGARADRSVPAVLLGHGGT